MKHDISDPITIASVVVRDHLDTVIQRHGSRPDDPVSAAVCKITTALLQHLHGETKSLRASERSSVGTDRISASAIEKAPCAPPNTYAHPDYCTCAANGHPARSAHAKDCYMWRGPESATPDPAVATPVEKGTTVPSRKGVTV